MNLILKNWPSFLLLCAGFVACYATFISSNNDQLQKDSIEELGKKNKKLSEEIIKLGKLSNCISLRIQEMTKINNELVQQSKELINKINDRTAYEAAQNIQTAELNMIFSPTINDNDDVNIKIGGNEFSHTVKELKTGAKLLMIDEKDPLSINFDNNNRILFSLKVFDLDGNLILEIEKNNWRPNKNFTGKYNYDNRGFEIIDNKGNVAINVEIIGDNKIIIQGIFPIKESNMILLMGDKKFITLPLNTTNPHQSASEYKQEINRMIESLEIKPLFKYTGKNWLHFRTR